VAVVAVCWGCGLCTGNNSNTNLVVEKKLSTLCSMDG